MPSTLARPSGGGVPGLSKKDNYYVVNRYIGVTGGYLGDFSYRTHAEFYGEYCDLDIDPFVYDGTTRERFIKVLEDADPRTQAAILSGVLEKYAEGSEALRTPESRRHVEELIAKCLGDADVGTPKLRISSDVVRRAIADAHTLMESSGPTSAVDRVHTALHGYLKAACDEAGIPHPSDASILGLFKLLKEKHPRLQTFGPHQDAVVQVLRSLGAVMDALNPARNRGSIAHPNDELLDSHEAVLFVNAARTVLQYLDAKLE
ncbi:MAG: abortive infection family protein [Actinobacteria bacterium]|nr:abortive infection family protein [Actinomycetota bacterium]